MTYRVEICLGSLGFEDFDKKNNISFTCSWTVTTCRASWDHRALAQLPGTRHGEKELSTASNIWPWRVWQHNMCCRLVLWFNSGHPRSNSCSIF